MLTARSLVRLSECETRSSRTEQLIFRQRDRIDSELGRAGRQAAEATPSAPAVII